MRRLRLLSFVAVALAFVLAPRSASADDKPKIRSVTPASATRGQVVDVVIEGVNLFPNEDVTTTRGEISLVVTGSSTATRLTVRLTIGEAALAGPVPLTIKTKTGVATTERFTVKLRAPVVTKLKPDVLARGGEYDVVVTGTSLSLAGLDTKVSVAEPLTAKVVGKPTDTSYKLHVVVPAEATPGPKAITFETADGKVTASLIVALAPPDVAKPKLVTVERGGSVEVSLDGKSLGVTQPVVLAIPDPDILVEAVGQPTATSIPLRIKASDKATPGMRTLVVRSNDGFDTLALEVRATTPVLSPPEPAGITRGSKVDVALGFAPLPSKSSFGLSVVPANSGVSAKEKSLGVFTLDVDATAVPGPRTLIATHPWGIATRTFSIGTRPPAVNGVTPSEVAPGASADLVFEGKNLEGGVISLPVVDPSVTLTPGSDGKTARLEVRADAKPGPRAIVVRTPDGIALAFLSIKGGGVSAPSVTSAAPTRLFRGSATKVTLLGTNLRGMEGAPVIAVRDAAGGEIAVKVGAATATSVELTLEPKADAPIGGCVVTVATHDGSTAAALLVLPSSPAITSIDPSAIVRGGIRDVTIVGTALTAPGGAAPTITIAAPGETGFSPVIASATAEKIVLTVEARATLRSGPYVVSLSHSDGGAAAVLRIEGTPPFVESVAPTIVGTPATVDLVVTGKNLIGTDGRVATVQVTRIGAQAALAPQVVKSSATSLTVRVTTTATAAPGPHVLVVKTIDGESAGTFSVVSIAPPVIQRLAPAKAPRNGGVLSAITGTGLAGATAVEFSGKGVTGVVLPGSKDTELLLRITVAADAEVGDRTFTVTTAGGQGASGSTVLTVE